MYLDVPMKHRMQTSIASCAGSCCHVSFARRCHAQKTSVKHARQGLTSCLGVKCSVSQRNSIALRYAPYQYIITKLLVLGQACSWTVCICKPYAVHQSASKRKDTRSWRATCWQN